jgi:hypothetical protein
MAPASAGVDATLAQFLCDAVGVGQTEAAQLPYAPLLAQVTAIPVEAIQKMPGALLPRPAALEDRRRYPRSNCPRSLSQLSRSCFLPYP